MKVTEDQLRAYVSISFKKYDIRHEGSLDISELSQFFNDLFAKTSNPKTLTNEEAKQLLDQIDTDHSGRVTEDQLFTALKMILSNPNQQLTPPQQPHQQPSPNNGWGAPPQPQQPLANNGWGTSPQQPQQPLASNGWGAPPQPLANNGWGAPPQPPANNGWGAPPQPPANNGWGAPPQSQQPPANDGWGFPPQPHQPIFSNGGWGTQVVNSMPMSNGAPLVGGGWGVPPSSANDGWGQPPSPQAPPQAPPNNGWGW